MMINTDAVKAVETLDMESEVLITSPGKNVPYKMKVTELVAAVETNKKKVYKALLTQSGTAAPTAVVLENTLGDIVWGYSTTGTYTATLSGAFTENKTFILATCSFGSVDAPFIISERVSDNQIIISTSDASSSGVYANSSLFNASILIEVYP